MSQIQSLCRKAEILILRSNVFTNKSMLQSFIKQYWLQILPWVLTIGLAIWVGILTRKPEITIQPPIVDNRIDSLEQVVNKLHSDLLDSRHDYDSVSSSTRTEIEYIRIQNAKEISNINNLTTAQRDSMWATFKP